MGEYFLKRKHDRQQHACFPSFVQIELFFLLLRLYFLLHLSLDERTTRKNSSPLLDRISCTTVTRYYDDEITRVGGGSRSLERFATLHLNAFSSSNK